MKIKPIIQKQSAGCGLAVIQMATQYFGMQISPARIHKTAKFSNKDGMTNVQIVETLRQLGMSVVEYASVDWEELRSRNVKAHAIIVSWMLNGYIGHVSLVDTVSKHSILLADSNEGKHIRLPKLTFLRLWMDYDDHWFPEKNTDIQLRWMAVVSQSQARHIGDDLDAASMRADGRYRC